MAETVVSPDFVPTGFFVMRTPLLPFEAFIEWTDASTAVASPDYIAQTSDACIARRSCPSLRSVFANPAVREALFIASPEFEERIQSESDVIECDGRPKIERALMRYFSRMASRPTPFGLFAGCSVGTVNRTTHLAV